MRSTTSSKLASRLRRNTFRLCGDRVGDAHIALGFGPFAPRDQAALAFGRGHPVGDHFLQPQVNQQVTHALLFIQLRIADLWRQLIAHARARDAFIAIHPGDLFQQVRHADYASTDIQPLVGGGGAHFRILNLGLEFHPLQDLCDLGRVSGLFWLYAAFHEPYRNAAVLTTVIFSGGLVSGRFVSLLVEGRPAPLLLLYVFMELALVPIGLWVFRQPD